MAVGIMRNSVLIFLVEALFLPSICYSNCGLKNKYLTIPKNFFEVVCDSIKCAVSIYDGAVRQDGYGCDSKQEFLEYVKTTLGRDLDEKYAGPYMLNRFARVYRPDIIQSGCDYLKVVPVYNVDTVTAFLEPLQEGLCPVFMNMNYGKGLYEAKIERVGPVWRISFYHNSKSLSDESEFTFFERPFRLFVEPCRNGKCRFYSAEKLPFARSSYEKAVLVNNIDRIKAECSFVQLVEDPEKIGSGFFVVNGFGKCKIRIAQKRGGFENVWVNVVQHDGMSRVYIEGNE